MPDEEMTLQRTRAQAARTSTGFGRTAALAASPPCSASRLHEKYPPLRHSPTETGTAFVLVGRSASAGATRATLPCYLDK